MKHNLYNANPNSTYDTLHYYKVTLINWTLNTLTNNDNKHTYFIMAFDESIAIDLVKAYNPTLANANNTFIYVQQI